MIQSRMRQIRQKLRPLKRLKLLWKKTLKRLKLPWKKKEKNKNIMICSMSVLKIPIQIILMEMLKKELSALSINNMSPHLSKMIKN
jgi:hypothetical protein